MAEISPGARVPAASYIDFAFLVSFLILTVIGVMYVYSPGRVALGGMPPDTNLLLLGIGGIAILCAEKVARGTVGNAPLLRVVIRNLITEFGVILGFLASFITLKVWPVVILGIMGMAAVVIAMRGEGDGAERGESQ